ncbi:MAG TPA: hypothetical protein VGL94_12615 [Ktedonobacteraceae bacterium]
MCHEPREREAKLTIAALLQRPPLTLARVEKIMRHNVLWLVFKKTGQNGIGITMKTGQSHIASACASMMSNPLSRSLSLKERHSSLNRAERNSKTGQPGLQDGICMGEDRAEAYGLRNSGEGDILVRITPTKIIFQRDIAS